ncbi:MAG TPA: hypothetical protein VE263_08925 [Candidatus Angelobacter sp.]|nr:hypothetical protein [Candidatus Angelobacter sp.]
MRRLRLPKMGPPKTKSFFEEYFYACVAVLFVAVSVLLIAGGLGAANALVGGAWVAGAVWFGKQLKGYFGEKAKEKEKKAAAATPKPAEGSNGKLLLPPGMKPMIGPQWPLRSGPWPTRPGLRTAPSLPKAMEGAPAAPAPAAPTPKAPVQPAPAPAAPGSANKPSFVYERPTLPDRKPKLPHNWAGHETKKPKR